MGSRPKGNAGGGATSVDEGPTARRFAPSRRLPPGASALLIRGALDLREVVDSQHR